MTATESQWTLQPYRTFSKPDIQFHKRLPRGHHGHICCHHLQSTGETQTSSPPKTRPFIRGFPKQAPSEMLLSLCFSSRNDGFTSPRGFVGLDSWQAAVSVSTTAPTGAQVEKPIHPSPVVTQGDFQPWHQLFLF